MATAVTCATLISFLSAWFLARLSIRAVLLCLPSAGPKRIETRRASSAGVNAWPCE
jgi:hypothetical protein